MVVDGQQRLNGLLALRSQIFVERVGALTQAKDFVLQALQIGMRVLAVEGQ